MALEKFDQYIKRIGDGYWLTQPIWGELQTTSVTPAVNNMPMAYIGYTQAMPSLSGDATAYIVTQVGIACSSSNNTYLFGKLTNFGSLNIATPTFTDGSTMGTATELGTASSKIWSPVLAQVTTALNATPGNFTITYKDQDDNTAETSASAALPASAPVNSAFWVPLNTGDYGAVDLTDATRTAGTTPSGIIKFWGMQPLALFFTSASFQGVSEENLITKGFNPLRLAAADTLGGFSLGLTTARNCLGEIYAVADL